MTSFRFTPTAKTSNTLIVLISLLLIAVGNLAFFSNVLKTYELGTGNALALASLIITFTAATVLVLSLVCFGRTTKPILIGIVLLSAAAAYFMDSYGVVISDEMLQNVVQTNIAESRDLINLKLLAYLGVLGVLPALVIGKTPLLWRGWRVEAVARLKLVVITVLTIVGIVLAFGSFYASFIREHKSLRTFSNPTYYIYSVIKLAHSQWTANDDKTITAIGTDARTPTHDQHRELVILVVGETARSDRFSLNGYPRETNPELSKADVISFTNFWACGTSTAISVPCMFSLAGRNGFDKKNTGGTENLLDVLQRAGANVLWLDNNSDSKGVALRVPYTSYRTEATNTVCDEECRDEGMLVPLQGYIDAHPKGDIFIVLHQMGNHGPAYYKRYPPAFEKFTPACQSNDLSQCTQDEISNAYDNAILYTDHFLARVIDVLKTNDPFFETAMIYISDHGESLGEKGTYLHGLPNAIAPDAQLHVPAIMWIGRNFDELNVSALRQKRGERFTHDNLFHTALGILEVSTSIYRPELDILTGIRKAD